MKISNNNLVCFLGAALGVFLWVTLLLPFAAISVGGNNLDQLPRSLISVMLVGATPFAAFPAILFYGGSSKKAWGNKSKKNYHNTLYVRIICEFSLHESI